MNNLASVILWITPEGRFFTSERAEDKKSQHFLRTPR